MKIKSEGDLCRHCSTPVVKKTHPPTWNPKKRKGGYYFDWWFFCPKCGAVYLVEEAKHWFDEEKKMASRKKHNSLGERKEFRSDMDRVGIRDMSLTDAFRHNGTIRKRWL